MDAHTLTIEKLHAGFKAEEFKATEVVKMYFDRIRAEDKEIGAYLSLAEESALLAAEVTDLKLAKGEAIQPLAGVPMAIKDCILVEGQPATAASKLLAGYTAAYDATAIARLKTAGAVILGKTNMDEFAMGSSTENSGFQLTRNPYDVTKVPGGSSGGSAAAVGGNLALAALGSDTGGSIRQPASFCGVVGLKPTYGAVSRYGLIALASSLDQIGPFAKTARDARMVFQALIGRDKHDSTSAEYPHAGEKFAGNFEALGSLTIGLPKEYFVEGIMPEVSRAIEETIRTLKTFGITFKEVTLPHTKYALSDYYIIMPAEASSNLARYDGIRYAPGTKEHARLADLYNENRSHGFGKEVKRRILLGTFVLSSGYYDAYYIKAQKVRRLIQNDFTVVFKDVDMLLTPTAPTQAFGFGEKTKNPLEMYLSDIFTIPANLAGIPAISVPVFASPLPLRATAGKPAEAKGLPIGFQLMGPHWSEPTLLNVAEFYERAVGRYA